METDRERSDNDGSEEGEDRKKRKGKVDEVK